MGVSDRAFTVELFYGVLRNLTLLDFWIGCLRPSTIDADLHDVLRLGLYQILVLGIPDHAAVHESVELARKKGRGLINAILRTATRQRDELRQRVQVQPLSVRESHPGFLISRWQKSFGAEATTALCRWNNQAPPIYARINQLQIDPEQFTHRYPDAQPSGHGSQFVRFVAIPKAALDRGHCYIQDPSTALACRMVNPQPGEKVLDACAAPGGKTGFLAEMMQNRGLIVACDRDPERVRLLQENVARLKAEIVQTIEHDWEKPIPRKLESLGPFDRILIDAPCTNTGVMRRRVDVRWRLRPEDLPRMQQQQLKIVEAALGLLRPAGILVYSTCSLESEENDRVMERLLAIGTNMRLLERKDLLPFRDKCDGAFAAALQENSGSCH
ncbi:MAG: rRNA ((967)-C(5))-methyltransferase [Spartobacteria bacterium]|nr:rRNA ((967)-C(5))-methyltransferase [Spartobacteria bacterium]